MTKIYSLFLQCPELVYSSVLLIMSVSSFDEDGHYDSVLGNPKFKIFQHLKIMNTFLLLFPKIYFISFNFKLSACYLILLMKTVYVAVVITDGEGKSSMHENRQSYTREQTHSCK